ncbi:MAG: hypothetical protein PHN47_05420 [Clostridia bacterium]|nr:hypothetical protein [Clostridia bacterium]MDD4571902.1 hypothetical protein [Clostridia bacterium]
MSFNQIMLFPPIAFLFFIIVSAAISKVSSKLAPQGNDAPWKFKPYAGGEEVTSHHVQPDYSEFFPYAFFFTVMHVVALILATVPAETIILPMIYVLAAVLALLILFRR